MQIFLRSVLSLAAVVAGAFLITAACAPDIVAHLVDRYQAHLLEPQGRIGSGIAGSALVLIPVLIILRWYASRRYAREISYLTDQGRVAVSLIAIEEALTRAIEQEPVVRKVQIRVYEDRVRKMVVIEAALTLWDDGDVSGVNRRCQQLLRVRFAELMPEQTAVQVHLTVHRLSHRRFPDEESGARAATAVTGEGATSVAGEPKVLLPGLMATHGGVDNQAGAELLRRGRETRESRRRSTVTGDTEVDAPAGTDAGARAEAVEEAPDDPEPARTDPGEDDDYADLYRGPNYPVEIDDEDDRRS